MPGFFDKMKSGITEKAAEAAIRSKEAIDSQQVKGKIGELEGQKRKFLLEIGEAALAMYKSGSFDEQALADPCQSILALEAQVAEREAELAEIHRKADAAIAEQKAAPGASAPGAAPAGTFCPNCGTATQGAKFCPSCGTKIG